MNQMIKETAALAEKTYGKETAKRIMTAGQARYEKLLAENSNESPALQKNTHKRVYPGIALYETMQTEGASKEDARRSQQLSVIRTTSPMVGCIKICAGTEPGR